MGHNHARTMSQIMPNMLFRKFEQLVVDTLEYETVSEYEEFPSEGIIKLTVGTEQLSFDLLRKLSSVLNTKLIDIGSGTREEGYCETCAYTQEFTTLTIRGVSFD